MKIRAQKIESILIKTTANLKKYGGEFGYYLREDNPLLAQLICNNHLIKDIEYNSDDYKSYLTAFNTPKKKRAIIFITHKYYCVVFI